MTWTEKHLIEQERRCKEMELCPSDALTELHEALDEQDNLIRKLEIMVEDGRRTRSRWEDTCQEYEGRTI